MSERQRCLDYLKERKVARSNEMDEALDLTPGRTASLLNPDVESGLLVMCKVENPSTGRKCNEYRYSVAGGCATEFRPLNARAAHVHRPAVDLRAATSAGGRATASARAESAPAAPPSEREVDGAPPRLGTIEKGIPIPPTKRPIDGALRAHLQQLEVGDSFETGYSHKACHAHAKKLGIQITYRPVCKEPGKKRVRIWRTK